MTSLGRLAIFLAYTYIIANSLLFAIWVVFYENIPEEYCQWYRGLFGEWPKGFREKDFIKVLTQLYIYTPILRPSLSPIGVAIILAVTFYNVTLLVYPVLLWWRRRTVFHAGLVAMTGALMPPYMHYLFFCKSEYIAYGLLLMTACYAIAWFLAPQEKRM